LRDLIGDDTFFAFWRDYFSRYTNHLVTGDDFFILLEEYTDQDLGGLLAEYFRTR
jgi:aminopeptidase N